MPGQFIKLPSVTAGATSSTPRIQMGAADVAAVRIPSLAHAVAAKTLTASSAGVAGRCRVTGLPLVPKGTASALQLRTEFGYVGVGLSSSIAAGLALPAGSASASYTAVVALHLDAVDIAGSAPTNPLYTFTAADVDVATVLRYYGTTYGTPSSANKLLSGGSGQTVTGGAEVVRPAGDWIVVAIDYNDNTKRASISVNGGAYASAIKATNHAPGVGGYFEIGDHLSTSSLRATLVGDLFVFREALLQTPLGQSQLAAVVAGLKADYGIA